MGHSASILRPLVSSRTKSLLSFTILIPVPLVLPTVRPPTSYRTAFKTSFKIKVVYLLLKIKKKQCHVLSIYSVTKSFFDEARLCSLVKISFRIFHGGHKNCVLMTSRFISYSLKIHVYISLSGIYMIYVEIRVSLYR